MDTFRLRTERLEIHRLFADMSCSLSSRQAKNKIFSISSCNCTVGEIFYTDLLCRLRKSVKKTFPTLIKKIISMYAKGMTTRQISESIEDIYGFEASEGVIKRQVSEPTSGIRNIVLKKGGKFSPSLDMQEHLKYIIKQELEANFQLTSSILIIEDLYLQTFLHTLIFAMSAPLYIWGIISL